MRKHGGFTRLDAGRGGGKAGPPDFWQVSPSFSATEAHRGVPLARTSARKRVERHVRLGGHVGRTRCPALRRIHHRHARPCPYKPHPHVRGNSSTNTAKASEQHQSRMAKGYKTYSDVQWHPLPKRAGRLSNARGMVTKRIACNCPRRLLRPWLIRTARFVVQSKKVLKKRVV